MTEKRQCLRCGCETNRTVFDDVIDDALDWFFYSSMLLLIMLVALRAAGTKRVQIEARFEGLPLERVGWEVGELNE